MCIVSTTQYNNNYPIDMHDVCDTVVNTCLFDAMEICDFEFIQTDCLTMRK